MIKECIRCPTGTPVCYHWYIKGYTYKLECFCFRNQTVQAGQTVEMPVVYFVDPKWAKDRDATGAGEITLSYTFFPVAPGAQADASGAKPPSPLGGPARAGL